MLYFFHRTQNCLRHGKLEGIIGWHLQICKNLNLCMAVQVCIYGESYLYQDSFKFIEIRMLYSKIQGVLSITWAGF